MIKGDIFEHEELQDITIILLKEKLSKVENENRRLKLLLNNIFDIIKSS